MRAAAILIAIGYLLAVVLYGMVGLAVSVLHVGAMVVGLMFGPRK